MFWKGTLLQEPREKPAHSHHPLLNTSPLTDTNLYSSFPPRLTLYPWFFLSSLCLYFLSCVSEFHFFCLYIPLPSWPSAAVTVFFNLAQLAASLAIIHRKWGHCCAVQGAVTCKSVSADWTHSWICNASRYICSLASCLCQYIWPVCKSVQTSVSSLNRLKETLVHCLLPPAMHLKTTYFLLAGSLHTS